MSLNGGIKLPLLTANPAESPAEGFIFAYVVGTSVRYKDSAGNVYTLSTGITAEEVQDIIGNIFQDTDSIDFTYDDEGNVITAVVKQSGIDHDSITGHGTNNHAAIDSHIANTNNPHSTTKSQVGLSNVDNTSDVNKPISTATQTALNGKEPSLAAGTTGQYYRGDKSWQTLDKSAVGLSNVDNTSDVNKPISTATQTALNGKEPSLAAGTTGQYYRGDKSWQTLEMASLSNFSSSPPPNATGQFIHWNSSLGKWVSTTGGWAFDVASSPSNGQFLQYSNVGSRFNLTEVPTANKQVLAWDSGYGPGWWRPKALDSSYISDFAVAAAAAAAADLADELAAKVDDSQVGAANGVASLDGSGKVPVSQLPSSIGGDTDAVLTADTTNSSNSTLVNLTSMGFTATANKTYRFNALLRFKTAAASTGVTLTLNTTTTAVGDLNALVDIPQANDGTSAVYHGSISSLGDVVTSASVQTSNTYFMARIEGIFVCTGGGTIVPQFRSEVNGSQVTIGEGSVLTYREIA